MTVAEVAELLQLNEQTIRNWIDDGALPAVRMGRRIRIKRTVIDEIASAGVSNPKPDHPPVTSASDFWMGEHPVGEPAIPGLTVRPREDPASRAGP